MESLTNRTVQELLDRTAIADVMSTYSRGVDRGDWELLRSTYHPDAHDDHGEYKGGVDGLVAWLKDRFATTDNSIHFLGNCLIEFIDPDLALVETYFASRRLRPPTADEAAALAPGDAMCRQSWGRYVDRFERRDGQWRVADRKVVLEARFTSVAKEAARDTRALWGQRDHTDPLYVARAQFGAR
jgi:hypothetical protein